MQYERQGVLGYVTGSGLFARFTRRELIKSTIGVTGLALLAACADADVDDLDDDEADEPEAESAAEEEPDDPEDEDEDESDEQSDESDDSQDGEGRTGGSVALADQVLPPTLDIQADTNDFLDIIGQQVYQPLVYLDPETKEPVAGLAESWELSDDGTTWTFSLRDGVTFHDDTPFTSEAVIASWDRLLDPETRAPRASLLGDENLVSYEAPDDQTVEVVHEVPMANFLANIARTFAMVISPTAIEEYGQQLSQNMVGTGPFTLREYEEADFVTIERWDDFDWAPEFFDHSGPAYLDEFTWHHIPEEGTRIAAFEAGDLEIVRLPWSQFSRFENGEMPNVGTITNSNPGVPGCVFLNSQLSPLDELDVRQAIARAIDREAIVNAPIFGGAVWVEYGPLTEDVLHYDSAVVDTWPEYDPEEAEGLLAEAGFEPDDDGILVRDGERLELTLPASDLTAQIAQVVQSQLEDIGIHVEISQMDATAVTEQWNSGNEHLVVGANTANDPDVLSDVFGPGQRSLAEDPEVFAMLEEGQQAVDPDERAQVYSELQHYLAEQVYTVHIYNSARNYAMLDSVQGIKFNDRAGIYCYDIWIEE